MTMKRVRTGPQGHQTAGIDHAHVPRPLPCVTDAIQATRSIRLRCARLVRRSAYTLLEVLIASVLVTALMFAVWSLLRTWSQLYDKGQARTQMSQLVRSLSDQFTEDVQSVVVPATPSGRRTSSQFRAAPADESTSDSSGQPRDEPDSDVDESLQSTVSSFDVREVALVGGKDWLVLDVVRTPNSWQRTNEEPPAELQNESGPQVYVPDLQRVIYTFQAAVEASESDGLSDTSESRPGLLRLAMAREFVGELEDQGASAQGPSRGTSLRTSIFEFRDRILLGDTYDLSSAIESQQPEVDEEAFVVPEVDLALESRDGRQGVLEEDFVPEIRWMEFRYSNGSTWSDSWDSSNGRGLPVAVEIRFELAQVEPVEEAVNPDEETDSPDDGVMSLDEEMQTESFVDEEPLWTDDAMVDETQTEETPYHRCVVVLGLAQPPAASSSTDLFGEALP